MSLDGIEKADTTASINSENPLVEIRQRSSSRRKVIYSTYVKNKRFSRYYEALRSLIPFKLNGSSELPVQDAGLFSFITSNWIVRHLYYSVRNDVGFEIPECPKTELSAINSARLNTLLKEEIIAKGINGSMFKVIWSFIKTRTIWACVAYFLSTIFSLIGLVIFLPKILIPTKEYNTDNDRRMFNIIYFTLSELLACIFYSWSTAVNLRTSIRLRSSIFSALYRHSLYTSLTYKLSSWQLVSFLLPEGQQIHELIMAMPHLLCTPVIILFVIGFAGVGLHFWGYLSVVIILVFFPILLIVALLSKNLLFRATIFSDQRIKLLEDFIVNNIYVKYFKKEDIFKNKIGDIRKKELLNMRKAGFFDNFSFSFIQLQPILSLSALFIASHWGEEMNNAKVTAVCIIMLVHLKQTLDNFWSGLNNVAKALISLQKFKEIMVLDTIDQSRLKPPPAVAFAMLAASFQIYEYDTTGYAKITLKHKLNEKIQFSQQYQKKEILKDINITAPKERLIGVCGPPNSGKSALLKAMMGLLIKTSGEVLVDGDFAYVSQEPVIFNQSLKDNILFELDMDTSKYYRVLNHCHLTNIESEIERDNIIKDSKLLTLEQRQRISLARAMYSDRDIYLLDSPLSAVDHTRAMQIFDNAILKSLNNKTRIVVTNKPEFLALCDDIWMLMDGTINLKGSHQELLKNQDYRSLLDSLQKQSENSNDKFNPFGTTKDDVASPHTMGQFETQDIFKSTLSIDAIDELTNEPHHPVTLWPVLKVYFINFGSLTSLFGLFLALLKGMFITVLPIYFISTISRAEYKEKFLGFYFAIFIVMLLLGTVINYFFNAKIFSSAAKFHDDILSRIYKATLPYFQEKSLSIISTVSLHLHLTDMEIPRLLHGILLSIFLIIPCFILLAVISFWYIIPILIMIMFMATATIFVGKALLNFNLFKMDLINVLYRHVVIILTAKPIIQAYNKMDSFSSKLYEDYDKYIVYAYIINAARSWLVFIIQMLSVFCLLTVCFMNYTKLANSDESILRPIAQENSTYLALALVCVFQICFALQRTSILSIDTSIAFDTLSVVEDLKSNILEEEGKEQGYGDVDDFYNIMFLGVSISHIYYTDFIIDDITFKVEMKEKMGFLGLTNVEKKAIISSLYRLNEIEKGQISIGAQDITSISLPKLRSMIAVIPSEVHMFNETIMNVLNPCKMYKDEDVVHALNAFGLLNRVSELPNKLQSSADLLSLDEKQILVLAQAYLVQNKIIIIEDFSAGSLMDKVLKDHLRELFALSTVLIFANDIECLLPCHRTILFENGKIIMIDKPKKIQSDKIKSPLSGMQFIKNVPETSL